MSMDGTYSRQLIGMARIEPNIHIHTHRWLNIISLWEKKKSLNNIYAFILIYMQHGHSDKHI